MVATQLRQGAAHAARRAVAAFLQSVDPSFVSALAEQRTHAHVRATQTAFSTLVAKASDAAALLDCLSPAASASASAFLSLVHPPPPPRKYKNKKTLARLAAQAKPAPALDNAAGLGSDNAQAHAQAHAQPFAPSAEQSPPQFQYPGADLMAAYIAGTSSSSVACVADANCDDANANANANADANVNATVIASASRARLPQLQRSKPSKPPRGLAKKVFSIHELPTADSFYTLTEEQTEELRTLVTEATNLLTNYNPACLSIENSGRRPGSRESALRTRLNWLIDTLKKSTEPLSSSQKELWNVADSLYTKLERYLPPTQTRVPVKLESDALAAPAPATSALDSAASASAFDAFAPNPDAFYTDLIADGSAVFIDHPVPENQLSLSLPLLPLLPLASAPRVKKFRKRAAFMTPSAERAAAVVAACPSTFASAAKAKAEAVFADGGDEQDGYAVDNEETYCAIAGSAAGQRKRGRAPKLGRGFGFGRGRGRSRSRSRSRKDDDDSDHDHDHDHEHDDAGRKNRRRGPGLGRGPGPGLGPGPGRGMHQSSREFAEETESAAAAAFATTYLSDAGSLGGSNSRLRRPADNAATLSPFSLIMRDIPHHLLALGGSDTELHRVLPLGGSDTESHRGLALGGSDTESQLDAPNRLHSHDHQDLTAQHQDYNLLAAWDESAGQHEL